MAIDVNELFRRINNYFVKFRVVSEEEIASAVAAEVSKLDDDTVKQLETELGGDLKQVLIDSIVRVPISVYSPNLTSKRNYLGETFYHYPTHDFLADELEEAFKRLSRIRSVGIIERMLDSARALLEKAGYQALAVERGEADIKLEAGKGERRLIVYIIPSIGVAAEYAKRMASDTEYVLVIPTEKTPAPFIQFCHDKADDFAGKKLQMWVVDPEKKTVNPFLGFTHDDDIYRQFDNPKLAAFACRMYGVGRDMWVRSS